MNISDIITKCYILALIIRDDGERLLLGDGFYEFKEQLQHFQPNTFQNDVIELQGTDGQLLAGQVRRGATQSFDGYIADSTISREATEEHRQRFLAFFRKKHHYKVVYVFPDGSAIKRERGYIVDAPSVPEMFQRFPEFHVGLNFEDVNYYEYDEGEDGEEIFAHVQNIAIAGYVEGGLIWDNYGAVSNEITWVDYALKTTTDGYAQITDGVLGAPLNLEQLFGNATQKTVSGKNKSPNLGVYYDAGISTNSGASITSHTDSTIVFTTGTSTSSGLYIAKARIDAICPQVYQDGYIVSLTIVSTQATDIRFNYNDKSGTVAIGTTATRISFQTDGSDTSSIVLYKATGSITPTLTISDIQVEAGSTPTEYTEYVGGIDSPNPDFPQAVNVVTGEQTVKIVGKNLFNADQPTGVNHQVTYTNNGDGSFTINGTSDAVSSRQLSTSFGIHLRAGETYSISANNPTANSNATMRFVRSGGGVFAPMTLTTANKTWNYTATQDDDCTVQIRFPSGEQLTDFIVKPQVEHSQEPTAFESYKSQSFTIDLGNEELAKIGTYRDRFYENDGVWYKHAEIGKFVFNGTEPWAVANTGTANFYYRRSNLYMDWTGNITTLMSNYGSYGPVGNNNTDIGIILTQANHNEVRIRYGTEMTADAWKTKLSGTNMILYYAMPTATDTQITDQTLIQELSTIKALVGETDNIWLIPSAGAQGEMEVRYSRGFINQGAGYEWDAAQGGGPNIVSVDGIDRTGFVWEVIGPATNPTLTNITTNQTMTFEGDVATGQTLTVNTSDQTAEIAGTNVFAQMEGEWMQLAPGNNVITYTATGATEPSKIKWNGVVG